MGKKLVIQIWKMVLKMYTKHEIIPAKYLHKIIINENIVIKEGYNRRYSLKSTAIFFFTFDYSKYKLNPICNKQPPLIVYISY